jgi:hypothetical protein
MNRGEEEEEEYFSRFLSLSLVFFAQWPKEGKKKVINYFLSSNTHSQLVELNKTEEIIILAQ